MRVLVVDDDHDLRRLTVIGLTKAGIEYQEAETAAGARALLFGPQGHSFDAVLLDVELPDAKGWDFLEEMRSNGQEIPVIFVSVHRALEDRLHGLRLGADDYITKPVVFEELVARLEAVLRRKRPIESVKIHDVTIAPYQRRIERNGKKVDLTPREFDILWSLVQAGGRPVSEKELLRRVWGIDFDPNTNVVQVHVFRLRKKLEAAGTRMIDTVRREGYRLTV
jgi:two-component system, OmpR family, response regulator